MLFLQGKWSKCLHPLARASLELLGLLCYTQDSGRPPQPTARIMQPRLVILLIGRSVDVEIDLLGQVGSLCNLGEPCLIDRNPIGLVSSTQRQESGMSSRSSTTVLITWRSFNRVLSQSTLHYPELLLGYFGIKSHWNEYSENDAWQTICSTDCLHKTRSSLQHTHWDNRNETTFATKPLH